MIQGRGGVAKHRHEHNNQGRGSAHIACAEAMGRHEERVKKDEKMEVEEDKLKREKKDTMDTGFNKNLPHLVDALKKVQAHMKFSAIKKEVLNFRGNLAFSHFKTMAPQTQQQYFKLICCMKCWIIMVQVNERYMFLDCVKTQ